MILPSLVTALFCFLTVGLDGISFVRQYVEDQVEIDFVLSPTYIGVYVIGDVVGLDTSP